MIGEHDVAEWIANSALSSSMALESLEEMFAMQVLDFSKAMLSEVDAIGAPGPRVKKLWFVHVSMS